MKQEGDLERFLEEWRRQPVPEPPANLAARVWRTIRLANAARQPVELLLTFSFPVFARIAGASALVAMGAGIVFGSAFAYTTATDPAPKARDALSMDVFKLESVGLADNFFER